MSGSVRTGFVNALAILIFSAQMAEVLQRIAAAMAKTLIAAAADERIPPELLNSMREVWKDGMTYADSAQLNSP